MKKISEPVWLLTAVLACVGIYVAGDLFASNFAPRNGWMVDGTFSKPRFGLDHSEANRSQRWTTDMPWASFRGLDPESVATLKGRHTFEFVRGAGSFVCSGEFSGGRGSGSYTFKPNPEFVAKLQGAGYVMPSQDDLFQMAMNNMPLELALELKRASANTTLEDLLDFSSNGLNAETIRGFLAVGMNQLSIRDFLDLRNHGVNAPFLRDLKESGYDVPAGEIVQLRDNGVDGHFLKALARTGLKPAVNDLIELRNNGVSAEALRMFSDAGVVDSRDVIEMKNNGVPAEFVKEAKTMGYSFSQKEIIEMRHNGVDGAYLRKLKDTGFNELDAEKIIKLRQHGID